MHTKLVEIADQAVNRMKLSLPSMDICLFFASLYICDGESHDLQKYTKFKPFQNPKKNMTIYL